jgi:hypothetical protein
MAVRSAVFKWMGVHVLIADTVQQHFMLFGGLIQGKHCTKIQAYHLTSKDLVFMAVTQ